MQAIKELTRKVDQLTLLVMKDKQDTTWLTEEQAAEMLGYKNPRSLRKKVKASAGVAPFSLIVFCHTNGRNWQYTRKSIVRFREATSTM